MPSPMTQSMRANSRPSFSSNNGYDTPVHNHAGVSNGDGYDSDSSNFAPALVSFSPLQICWNLCE